MEKQKSNLKLIDLSNSSIHLNQENNFYHLTQLQSSKIQTKYQKNLTSQQKQKFVLLIKFNLIQIQQLTALKPVVNLFRLGFGLNFSLNVDLKLSKIFDLQRMMYFMQLATILANENGNIQKIQSKVITSQCSLSLNHQVQIKISFNQLFASQEFYVSTLQLGNKKDKWAYVVENFKASLLIVYPQKSTSQKNQQTVLIQNLYFVNDFSYPLIDQLRLQKDDNKQFLINKISQLQNYSSPQTPSQISQKKLYICHDMKGGYIQDTNTFTPFRQKSKTYHYRYNYLDQTYIFNYFSHYPITIPPKMWRDLCRKYKTLCLGTFIVENNDLKIKQENFLTQEFALKLIYIAKRAKFDGYLINIQVVISKPQQLLKWLVFLTKQMNKSIPGSQIVWYDSVITNGEIRYQNQLNNYNNTFYQACNGMFTNYWWNQQSLKNSIQNKIKQKPIYIGNDCFGRNTYGGGKYDIYKAVNKILQIGKNQLSVALFAPGFTYEDNGQRQQKNLVQNQLKMYHGKNITRKNIQKWKNTRDGGQGWKIQNQWAVTSFQVCKRQALIKISDFQGKKGSLKIHFTCYVTGTGPNFQDYYKISMQVLDYKSNLIYVQKTFPRTVSTNKQQFIEIIIQIDCELIGQNVCAKILEEGKSVEYWAGHFGSRFKEQKVSLISSEIGNGWINNVTNRSCVINKNYITYFNKGEGESFAFKGNKIQNLYSSLGDYDCPPILYLNDSSKLQINHNSAYIGGTCLQFSNTNKVIINRFQIGQWKQNQISKVYEVLITVKNNKPIKLIISNSKDYYKFQQKFVESNGWKVYRSQIKIIKQEKQFQLVVEFQQNQGAIGLFSLNSIQQNSNIQLKKQLNLQLEIKLNKISKHILPYFIDIILDSQQVQENILECPQRLLVKAGNFCGFLNIQMYNLNKESKMMKLQGFLKNIPVLQQKVQQINIQIYSQKFGIPQILFKQIISKSLLNNLIQNKSIIFKFKI